MGVQHRKELRERLLQAGWAPDTPVLIGERLGYPDEQTYPCRLEQLPDLPVQTPAVLLVGIQSAGESPVTLFTGTHPEYFLKHGPLLHWPMITLEPVPLQTRAATLARWLPAVDGILFPSRVAVTCFLEALLDVGDTRQLAGKYLLAVGPSTADTLAQHGLRADLAAHALQGVRDLATRIPDSLQGTYLYPCSDAAPTTQRTAFLADFGITLIPEVFYQNQPAPPLPLPKQPFHRVLFTSSSTAQTYFDRYPDERHANRTWLAVGPSTLETLQSLHLPAEILPP
jgi:uroporphyrinogen-III synthase